MNPTPDAQLLEYMRERDEQATKRRWRIVYAVTALVCVGIGLLGAKAITDDQHDRELLQQQDREFIDQFVGG